MLTVPVFVRPWLVDKGPTWYGLDVSWQMTLNYAWIKNLSFGTAIVYTYGPLGFLATRFGWGIPLWAFVLFDAFVVLNFFFVFKDFIINSANKVVAILILFGTTLLLNTLFGTDLSWVLLFFIYYWLFKTYKDPRLSYFFIIAILASLSFYIRLYTGFMGFLFLFIHLAIMVVYKKIRPLNAALVVFITSVTFGASLLLLHVSLAGYIKNALEIIKGYNDIMHLNESHAGIEKALLILFMLLSLLYISHCIYLLKKKRYSQLFYSLIGIAYVCLLKKQSSLRNDVQHLSEFFACATLVLISGNLLLIERKLQNIICVFILGLVGMSLFFNNRFRPLQAALHDRYTIINEYRKELREYDSFKYQNQPDKRLIPAAVLKKIGDKTVDIFPWDTEYLIENKLNYTPRPVFQSFFAYTGRLEKINYDFYAYGTPEFVIYDYDAIDNRYPFNDESLVNLFLTRNYTLQDSFTFNERWKMLLQKNILVYPLVFDSIRVQSRSVTAEIPIDSCSFLKIYADYSLRGKLHSILKTAPEISIMYLTEDGEWHTYKTSRELLKSGIWVGRFIASNRDFWNLVTHQDNLQKILKVKLLIKDTRYVSPQMKVEYFNIE